MARETKRREERKKEKEFCLDLKTWIIRTLSEGRRRERAIKKGGNEKGESKEERGRGEEKKR